MPADDPPSEYSRRTFMGAFAGGALGLSLGAPQAIETAQQYQSVLDVAAIDLRMRGLWPGHGIARGIDTNRDGDTDVEINRVTRNGTKAIQITSNGIETPDYGVSLVNVQPRDLTLGELASSDTSYEYAAGEQNDSAVPDEVWLVLKSRQSGHTGRHYVCRTEVDASPSGWTARPVDQEITGDFSGAPSPGSGHEWKEFHVNDRSLTKIGDDLTAIYGIDATVQGIGVGRGTPTTEPSTLNTYYANLVVAGEGMTLPR